MRIPRLPRRAEPLADMLASALDAVASGATVEQALARSPQQAAELRPLLEAALRARALAAPEPSDDARLIARAALLRAATARRAPAPVTPHPAVRRSRWLVFAPAVLAAGVFAGVALPLVGALDAGAIPGDWNYGLKRAGERVQLALTTDTTDRRLLRLAFARRRLDEIEKLSQNGQVDVHSTQVVTLVHEYTVDLSQVQSSVASAPAVDDSTKQAVDKTTQAAQTVLQPIAQNASPQVASPAQSALASTDQTKATADSKPSTSQSSPQVAKTTPTSEPQPVQTVAPSSVATPAPIVVPAATPAATPEPTPPPASPSPEPSSSPTATVPATPSATPVATPAPTAVPTSSGTPPLRPDQILPAVTFTASPTPAATPAPASPTVPPTATATPPIVVAAVPAIGAPASASPSPTPVPAAASATFGPPSHTASPTPAPLATRPAAALTAAPSSTPVALQVGDNTLRYSGVPLPLDVLLAPILPDVIYVSYTDAAGLPHLWYRGTPAPSVGAGNGVFIVRVSRATSITLP